jgi:hypothetical protein
MATNDNWEARREELMRDSDRYRDKWAVWKVAYYAGLLTVCGVFLAVVPIFAAQGATANRVARVVSILAVVACACVLYNMTVFIRLYEMLGFDRIPKDKSDEGAYHDNQLKLMDHFFRYRRRRRIGDRVALFCLGACVFSILVLIFSTSDFCSR